MTIHADVNSDAHVDLHTWIYTCVADIDKQNFICRLGRFRFTLSCRVKLHGMFLHNYFAHLSLY